MRKAIALPEPAIMQLENGIGDMTSADEKLISSIERWKMNYIQLAMIVFFYFYIGFIE